MVLVPRKANSFNTTSAARFLSKIVTLFQGKLRPPNTSTVPFGSDPFINGLLALSAYEDNDSTQRPGARAAWNATTARSAGSVGDVGFMSGLTRCESLAAMRHAECMCTPNP